MPPETAADPDGNADASPPAFPEQIYEQATARLAVIIDEWQKARDACLRRWPARTTRRSSSPNHTDGGVGLPDALEMLDDPARWTGPSPQQGDEAPAGRRLGRSVSERGGLGDMPMLR